MTPELKALIAAHLDGLMDKINEFESAATLAMTDYAQKKEEQTEFSEETLDVAKLAEDISLVSDGLKFIIADFRERKQI